MAPGNISKGIALYCRPSPKKFLGDLKRQLYDHPNGVGIGCLACMTQASKGNKEQRFQQGRRTDQKRTKKKKNPKPSPKKQKGLGANPGHRTSQNSQKQNSLAEYSGIFAKTSAKQKRDRARDSHPHGRLLLNSQPKGAINQKNPRAHKSKNRHFPPPQKPKIPPPLKRGILWTWFFLQNGRIFPGVHKIGAAISGPRIADKNFTDTRIFLMTKFAVSGRVLLPFCTKF